MSSQSCFGAAKYTLKRTFILLHHSHTKNQSIQTCLAFFLALLSHCMCTRPKLPLDDQLALASPYLPLPNLTQEFICPYLCFVLYASFLDEIPEKLLLSTILLSSLQHKHSEHACTTGLVHVQCLCWKCNVLFGQVKR